MKILRGMTVAWMVFWLAASGALAAAMPYCDHALRSSAAMDGMGMQMQNEHASSHHGHENAPVAEADTDHASHHGSGTGDGHSGIACDKCGACNLMNSAIPATTLLGGISQLHAVQDSFVLSKLRGWFPEQPYHPPRISRSV
jgi:hypothetical protein